MTSYENFIEKVGNNLPELPQNAYRNVRFRVVGQKFATGAMVALPTFAVAVLALFFFTAQPQDPLDDFFATGDNIVFSNLSFYSLWD